MAGDIPDLQHLYLPVMDYSLAALTACTLAFIPNRAMRELVEARPGVMAALWRGTLVDASVHQERIETLGRRQALRRLAHLFCEKYLRQSAVGLAGATADRADERQPTNLVAIGPKTSIAEGCSALPFSG